MSFDFKNSLINKNDLSYNNIISSISELMLWRYYLNIDFKLGVPINAPYRVDNRPSFCLYKTISGRIRGKDFGGDFSGGIIDYIMMIYNLSFFDVLVKINLDFQLGLTFDNFQNYTVSSNIKTRYVSKNMLHKLDKFEETTKSTYNILQANIRAYNEKDIDYWTSFGITARTLKLYNIYCAEKIYLNNRIHYSYKEDNPAYIYYFKKSNHIKVYFPNQIYNRFLGNVNNYEDIQGYYQCDVKGDNSNKILILTKSMKDVMLLREYNIDAMAIHGENHRFHSDFIRHLKKYYPNIISLYDRDKSGILGARSLWREYKIKPFFINKEYNTKDISDLFKLHGSEVCNNFLNTLKQI